MEKLTVYKAQSKDWNCKWIESTDKWSSREGIIKKVRAIMWA